MESGLTVFTLAVQLRPSEPQSPAEPVPSDDPIEVSSPPRRRRFRRGRVIGLLLLLLVLVVVALAVAAIPLLHARSEAKAAEGDLSEAHTALSAHQLGTARQAVSAAESHISSAQHDANGFGGDVWSHVPVFGSAVTDARHLVDALDEATQVASLGVKAYSGATGPHSKLITGSTVDLPALEKLSATVSSIGPHLTAAQADVASIKANAPFLGSKIGTLRDEASSQLTSAQNSYQTFQPLLQQMPKVLGADGPRQYLIAMMNPSEQRYSGGATLTMSMLHFSQGKISFGQSYSVAEVEHLQPFLHWPRVHGNTLLSKSDRRLTAATFSPWWQVSGEELSRAWQAQTGQRPNGVFAIDLQALAGLFRLTGPVQVPGYGQLTADNLVSTLAGSYSQFQDPVQRHALNLAIIPAFRSRFMSGGKFVQKGQLLRTEAEARHVALYFRDRGAEKAFAGLGFSGNLSTTPQDYIGVFSQNLNGSKTDYYQHRVVSSEVHLRADGSAADHLHVTITNAAAPYSLPGLDPQTGYATSWLGASIGVFLPNHPVVGRVAANGKPFKAHLHKTQVPFVHNRPYFHHGIMLDAGQSATIDARYVVPQAAVVNSDGTMTYRLDVDPQDLVVPETLRVAITWPQGWSPTSLPSGWHSTSGGAEYDGPVSTALSFEFPLAHH